MSIFKNLFGGNRKTEPAELTTFASPETIVIEKQQDLIPPVDLFLDNEPPSSEQVAELNKSKIVAFIERDWNRLGLNDGYEYGTQEVYELQIKHIKSEFRKIIDQMVDEKRISLTQLRNRKIEIGSLSDSTVKQLEVVIDETQKSLEELVKEKSLSAENEGLVMNAIHPYSLSFKKGLHSKEEERMILYPISYFINSKNNLS